MAGKQEKKTPSPASQPLSPRVTIPREYALPLVNINKAVNAMDMATDYLRVAAQQIQSLGVDRQREIASLAKVEKQYLKKEKKPEQQ